MIKLENLTKVYTSKYGSECKALDNVSFSIQDKGMVFICGKSGSGKSTMINLLAGLDEITSGDILVDGNRLSEFNIHQFDEYRNSVIGFIFQDFCLMDTFTVSENIMLSLDLQGIDNESLVEEMLKKVGLEGLGARYPKELSGGQKQRVAIARALVKNPKYILADEPTGNLDSETSIQILDLLKELSKEKLVLIISHSNDNALEYGDRIIELADGKVIKDVSKNYDDKELVIGDIIYMPVNKKLTIEELDLVNDKISTGKYKVSQEDKTFIDTVQPDYGEVKEMGESGKLSIKNIRSIAKKFSINNRINLIITTIMVSLLVVLMVTTQVFTGFNGKHLLEQALDPTDEFVLNKGYIGNKVINTVSKDLLVNISEEEINSFYEQGYSGNIYKLYSFNVPPKHNSVNNHTLVYGSHIDYYDKLNFYIEVGKGVLECDQEYLCQLYDTDELKVLAGTLEDTGKSELVITDYFAECLMLYRGYEDYQEILNTEKIIMSLSSFNVKAIIDTDYEQRYGDIEEMFYNISHASSLKERNDLITSLQESQLYLDFYNDLINKYSICYYIDGDFRQRLREDNTNSSGCWYALVNFKTSDGVVNSTGGTFGRLKDDSLNDGEIKVAKGFISRLYGVDESLVTEDLVKGLEITVNEYYRYDTNYENICYSKTYKVVGLFSSSEPLVRLSSNDFYEAYDVQVFPYAVYFDNVESISSIYNPIEHQLFYSNDKYIDGIYSIMNIVAIFNDFFKIITIGIGFVCVFLLISFGRRNIKRRMYEIGVIRALGGKNKELYIVFLYQILYLLFFVSIISSITLIFLDDVINNILIENIMLFLNNKYIENLNVISFNPILIIVNLVSLTILTILSSLSLLTVLRKIKPINIIRKKED